jgi:hypothetical protein
MKGIKKSCQHIFSISNKNNSALICKLCGVLKVKNLEFFKPENYLNKCEFDKFEIFEKFKQQKIFENTNTDYLKHRHKIIKYLQQFANVCKFSDETFNQCLYLIDIILSSKNNPFGKKYDMCVIGCLLLSGKIL